MTYQLRELYYKSYAILLSPLLLQDLPLNMTFFFKDSLKHILHHYVRMLINAAQAKLLLVLISRETEPYTCPDLSSLQLTNQESTSRTPRPSIQLQNAPGPLALKGSTDLNISPFREDVLM